MVCLNKNLLGFENLGDGRSAASIYIDVIREFL
ncbi:hypothetical protein PMI13_03933 [Chryseobacterium populi]|uniref:Uncharacterized protein n=1 Tax=Chryseobacterium populi TaxID=1144316 RepID=J2K4A4_9FLAO|nr:hypothetical protein PMI13_03933 [Chryseobacterium populi]